MPAVLCSAAAFAQPSGAPAIAGQVRGADNKPVAGADVILRWRLHPELPGLLGRALGNRGLGERRHRADGEGRFKLEPPLRGPFVVVARKDGQSSTRAFPVMAGDYLVLRLEPDHNMAGHVVTADGRPVAGATVALVPYSETWSRLALYRVPERTASTRTDAKGRFRLFFTHGYLREPFWGDLMSLQVVGSEVGGASQHIVRPTAASTRLRLEVSRLQPLEGRLIDTQTRQPVAGATVQDAYLPGLPGHTTVTKRDGRFTLPGTVGIELHVVSKDHAPQSIRRAIINGEPSNAVQGILGPGHILRAQLLDATAAPLSKARVIMAVPRGDSPPMTWIQHLDKDGRLLVHAPSGPATLLGFVEVEGHFLRFHAAAGTTADKDLGKLTVRTPVQVRGKVLDAHRMPIARARVLLYAEHGIAGVTPRVTYTDRGGRFRFDHVVDRSSVLAVGADANGQTTVALDSLKMQAPITITMPAGREIAGVIKTPEGDPMPHAWVSLYKSGGSEAKEAAGPSHDTTALCVLTDGDGRFRFRGLDGETSWQVVTTFIRAGRRYYGEVTATGGEHKVTLSANMCPDQDQD